MELDREMLDRLDLLAHKLGVTAEHLWNSLVKRERIRGYIASILVAFYAALVFICGFYFAGAAARWELLTDFNGHSLFIAGSTAICVVVGLICVAEIPGTIESAVSGIFAAEGNAVEELLSILR